MPKRYQEPSIDCEKGFTPENDIFSMKDFGQKLMLFVQALNRGVIILDGEWGIGKTSFIKMWAAHCKEQEKPVIYYDAFAHDYAADVFSSLAAEIVAYYEEKSPQPALDTFIEKTLNVGKALAPHIAKHLFAKVGLTDEALAAVCDAAQAANTPSPGTQLKERLTSRNKEKQCFKEFREALAALVAKEATPKEEGTGLQTLAIVIDELDRCKPPYALAILETIKHFYEIPNIVFILVTNMKQLEGSVTHQYGTEAGSTYLEKFYTLRLHLPVKNPNSIPDKHHAVLYLKGKLRENYPKHLSRIIEQKLNLRSCNKFILLQQLTQHLYKYRDSIPMLATYFCLVKLVEPDLFNSLRYGTATYEDIQKLAMEPHDSEYLCGLLKALLNPNSPERKEPHYSKLFFSYSTPENLLYHYCNTIENLEIMEG